MRAPSERDRLDTLRRELMALWTAPAFDERAVQRVTAELRHAADLMPIAVHTYDDTEAYHAGSGKGRRPQGPGGKPTDAQMSAGKAAAAQETPSANRARAYMARAIEDGAPHCGRQHIAWLVGASESYVSQLHLRLRKRNIAWWSPAALARVTEAVRAAA